MNVIPVMVKIRLCNCDPLRKNAVEHSVTKIVRRNLDEIKVRLAVANCLLTKKTSNIGVERYQIERLIHLMIKSFTIISNSCMTWITSEINLILLFLN